MGSPSGTATTISVTATINVFRVCPSKADQVSLSAPGLSIANAPAAVAIKRKKNTAITAEHTPLGPVVEFPDKQP